MARRPGGPAALRPARRGRAGERGGRRRPARGAGPPGRRPPRHHGLRPAAGPIRGGPRRTARPVAHRIRRPVDARHPGLAGGDHGRRRGGRRQDRTRIRPQRPGIRRTLHDPHGSRNQPLLPFRPDLPDVPRPDHHVRHPRGQRRRLGALRRPGEGPPDHGLGELRLRPGLAAAGASDDRHGLVLPDHRPVALRRRPRGGHGQPPGAGKASGQDDRGLPSRIRPARMDAELSDLRPQPPGTGARGPGGGRAAGRVRRRRAGRRTPPLRRRGPRRRGEPAAHPGQLAHQPARLLRQGHRILHASHAGHAQRRQRRRAAGGQPPGDHGVEGGSRLRQARPHVDGGLPEHIDHPALRRRAARRHLVRETRPVVDGHAPLHALLQRGRRPAVGGPDRLRDLPGARPPRLRDGPRASRRPARRPGGPALPRLPRRIRHSLRPRGRTDRVEAGRGHAQDRSSESNATTGSSGTNSTRSAPSSTRREWPPRGCS